MALADRTLQRRLSAVAVRLAAEYDGVFSRETVERVVQDSIQRLGPTTITFHLPLLSERFARQRLRAAALAEGLIPKTRPLVLFVCVQNAARSQIAAALARHVSQGRVEAISAGSDPASAIGANAARAIEELGIELAFEFPKPLTDDVVRAADVVVTMGCGDACPVLAGPRYLDWPIADPAGQDLDTVRQIRQDIADHILDLLKELLPVTDAVAVITDIHANLPALEAALARIDELGIDEIYCGGDLVGYGPHPNQVCALVADRAIPTIYGNYDYAIARDLDDCGCAYITPEDRELGQRSVEWTLAHTDQASKDFMRELPFDLSIPVGTTDVHLVHGSPRKVNEYLFEDKPARLYERLAAAESDQVLVFGHTHRPWVHEYGGVLFVNCGSVGKPKDGDPRAAFAILRATADGVDVTIERVSYDAAAVAREVAESGLPSAYADKLLAAA